MLANGGGRIHGYTIVAISNAEGNHKARLWRHASFLSEMKRRKKSLAESSTDAIADLSPSLTISSATTLLLLHLPLILPRFPFHSLNRIPFLLCD